jgi:hypothetical protein
MKYHSLIMIVFVLTAVIASCDRSHRVDNQLQVDEAARQLDDATFYAGLDPSDNRIIAFVAWLTQKGVTLEYAQNEERRGAWTVVEPEIARESSCSLR